MSITEQDHARIEAELRQGRVGIVPRVAMEVRDLDEKRRRLLGRAVPYDVEIDLGWYKESMAPGVFTKSIKESAKGLPLLLFHDSRQLDSIIGVNEEWQDTKAGLDGVWLLDDDDSARRAAEKAESGSLGFMSVGFQPKSGEAGSQFVWDDDDVLHVRRVEARLLETSLTPTPAYADAVTTKVRSQPEAQSTPSLHRWQDYLTSVRTTEGI
ncbi:HK97 family phage prohead protease [uncultured Friedmanniella sp.]|uniref:HK97 family phage prohead protease n=1 Tax=uncultured Friedmanniella sp. TaxID=335381 RepID=UPI0035CC69B2